jgi:hypothetical protein
MGGEIMVDEKQSPAGDSAPDVVFEDRDGVITATDVKVSPTAEAALKFIRTKAVADSVAHMRSDVLFRVLLAGGDQMSSTTPRVRQRVDNTSTSTRHPFGKADDLPVGRTDAQPEWCIA